MDGRLRDGDKPRNIARIYIIDAPYQIDIDYIYYIPDELRDSVAVGVFVIVPFGGGNRKQFGLVTELVNKVDTDIYKQIKPIVSLLYEGFSLDSELLRLCSHLRETTVCTMGEAVRAVLPTAAFGKINEYYTVIGELVKPIADNTQAALVYNRIKKLKRATAERLHVDLSIDPMRALRLLTAAGLIESEVAYRESGGGIYSESLTLTDKVEAQALLDGGEFKRSPKQEAIIRLLCENERCTSELVKTELGDVRAQLKALVDRGIVGVERKELYRDPYASKEMPENPDDNILSDCQQRAYDRIAALYDSGEPKAALLHGVTGSGKTRVIKALCDRVIAAGRSVILLIPEIALTPQTVGYFRACYKERIAVIHSSLSQGERFDMWKKIKRGEVDICVGTRSAIFAPFKNIGMIVIDEEQEHTYKSDSDPKYHARDIARFRCAEHKALMLLSSATPSLESYYKAESGIYTLVNLSERYGEAKLPEVIICDMRSDTASGKVSPIGERLKLELEENLRRGEQSILFLNRRGYNNFVSCPQCGGVVMCPHCSVSLTYHTYRSGGERTGYLSCHYCGYRQSVPESCPSCGGKHLTFLGYGTQKVEEELRALFPQARILRMDADTTGSKFAYDEIIGDFRSGGADILIGTQMVTKGHDFPNVTLSAVLSADSALYLDDYHANERSFAMICQLVGRAGRGSLPGRALIQTYNPDHPVVQLAAKQDYPTFYKNEIALRRALIFPPFCDILLLTITSGDEGLIAKSSVLLDDYVKKVGLELYPDVAFEMFGPFEAPVYRVNEKYRMRVILKLRINKRTRAYIRTLCRDYSKQLNKNCTLTVDINPNSL